MSITKPQKAPLEGDTAVGDLLLEDIRDRIEFGRKKYGTELKINNGRDPVVDGYQEVLDLAFYFRQYIEEGKQDYMDLYTVYSLLGAIKYRAEEREEYLDKAIEIVTDMINRRFGHDLTGSG